MTAMSVRRDPITLVAAVAAVAATAWLAGLMIDQFDLFAEPEELARAAEARVEMIGPTILLSAAGFAIGMRVTPIHGLGAALPIISVALAWAVPDSLYQGLAYILASPLAVGAALAVALPLEVRPHPAVSGVTAAVIAAAAFLGTPMFALAAAAGGATWWRLSGVERASR